MWAVTISRLRLGLVVRFPWRLQLTIRALSISKRARLPCLYEITNSALSSLFVSSIERALVAVADM